MSRVNNAVECYNQGFNCSQAIFSTYSEQLGLDRETALKVACPFGGGMARMGFTCGAVTGAYMLIGLKYGKCLPEDNDARENTYRLVREFTDKFKEIYGSIECHDLLSCDIGTEKGRIFATEHSLFKKLCPCYVGDAAKIIEDLLELE